MKYPLSILLIGISYLTACSSSPDSHFPRYSDFPKTKALSAQVINLDTMISSTRSAEPLVEEIFQRVISILLASSAHKESKELNWMLIADSISCGASPRLPNEVMCFHPG